VPVASLATIARRAQMSKQSTYQIQQDAYAWLDAIEASDGEVSDDAQAQLDIILGDAQTKAAALFFARQRCKAMQAEAKELAEIARVQNSRWVGHEKRVMGLMKTLLEAKAATGEEPALSGAWGSASLRRVKSLTVMDDLVHGKWWKTKQVRSIDTVAIKAAIKAGQTVEGCALVELVSASIRSK